MRFWGGGGGEFWNSSDFKTPSNSTTFHFQGEGVFGNSSEFKIPDFRFQNSLQNLFTGGGGDSATLQI